VDEVNQRRRRNAPPFLIFVKESGAKINQLKILVLAEKLLLK
jgi:hypothetical protein